MTDPLDYSYFDKKRKVENKPEAGSSVAELSLSLGKDVNTDLALDTPKNSLKERNPFYVEPVILGGMAQEPIKKAPRVHHSSKVMNSPKERSSWERNASTSPYHSSSATRSMKVPSDSPLYSNSATRSMKVPSDSSASSVSSQKGKARRGKSSKDSDSSSLSSSEEDLLSTSSILHF